jgi:formylglycine-generating enzyme required for sulfatase activity
MLTNSNTALDYVMVNFDLSWENSWRNSSLESNWDAAWVFVKYRIGTSGVWSHATLNASGHVAPFGSVIATSSDARGIFIHREVDGSGTNNWASVQLQWNYGLNGLLDSDGVEVCVYAIEMVYIPTGSFYVGDGTASTVWGQFESGTSGNPFQVISEGTITLGGGGAGSLGNNNATGMSPSDDFSDGVTRTLPAAFPKGYNSFYIMKYELTQAQYVDFLNKLSYTQQASRTAVAPNSAAGTGALSNNYRNGIDIMVPGINPGTPAIYSCNLNGNAVHNEAADGGNVSCNFLSWNDLAAYLDWSGLRPMTELEYEKACRGNETPVANEYAWGNTTLSCATAVSNSGMVTEVATVATAKCNCNNSLGVMRAGCFAKATTLTRSTSGGSYYGVLDLTGSLWEASVTLGNTNGRAYTGIHGDGVLTAGGNANVTNWPGATGSGIGYRGGAWPVSGNFLRVSARVYQNYISNTRDYDFMGRGVRSL